MARDRDRDRELEEAYWQGSTDEKLKALFIRMGRVEDKIDSLISWRAYVMGIAAAIAGAVAVFIDWIRGRL